MATPFEKFTSVLKELFMLDQADLDFGIYRIINQKRNEIERFLNEDLKKQVQALLKENDNSDTAVWQSELNKAIAATQSLGLNPDDSPKVQELKNKLATTASASEMEGEVYSHLATFFNRYYDNGDFLSNRRYKKDVYAIPYEGEEVKLHWANADQYYIKTSESFQDYSFKTGDDKTIHFRLRDASTEMNNNKTQADQERRFAIATEDVFDVNGDELSIFFTYEPKPKSVKQKDLTEEAISVIKTELRNLEILEPYKVGLLSLAATEKNKSRTLFEKHLNDYVSKNSFDYFIHKDLGGFLRRELDFYIKNEVLFIDDISSRSPEEFVAYLTQVKTIKAIGDKLITFLAQLENFQKKLWLKKKFVVETNYCITLDRVPEELYKDIIVNDAQREEWVRLFAIDKIQGSANNSDGCHSDTSGYSIPLTTDFLKANPFLVLDTAFFDDSFKQKLLSSFDNFEEHLDGTLINSENFQALNLLHEKYNEQVKCIYIDPPYNTGGNDFVYKDNYQESSWLSLISDRLEQSKSLFKEGGSIAVSIDIKELDKLICLMDSCLGSENRKANITVRRASITGAKVINPGLVNISENVVLYSNGAGKWLPQDAYKEKGYDNRYNVMITNVNEDISSWSFSTVLEEFSKYKGIKKSKLRKTLGDNYEKELLDFAILNAESIVQLATLDLSSVGNEAVELHKISVENPDKIYHIERADLNDYYITRGKVILFYKDRLRRIGDRLVPVEKVSDIWDDVLPNDIHNEGGVVLKKGKKPEKLIDRILESTTKVNDLVLDYFAGSGTSAAVSLKMKRKFINIELGEYFDMKTLRRLKNTLYGDKSGVTDKYFWKGGGFIKYIRLEQYEDTLNNLIIQKPSTIFNDSKQFQESYLLSYMMDIEARGSLFNLKWFVNPFDVKMKITKQNELKETQIDLVETFNYLIGLKIYNTSYPKAGLCVVEGTTRTGEKCLIIWRNCEEIDNKVLNDFFKTSAYSTLDHEYDRIYVNGDNLLQNIRKDEDHWKVVLIEEEFSKRMFEA